MSDGLLPGLGTIPLAISLKLLHSLASCSAELPTTDSIPFIPSFTLDAPPCASGVRRAQRISAHGPRNRCPVLSGLLPRGRPKYMRASRDTIYKIPNNDLTAYSGLRVRQQCHLAGRVAVLQRTAPPFMGFIADRRHSSPSPRVTPRQRWGYKLYREWQTKHHDSSLLRAFSAAVLEWPPSDWRAGTTCRFAWSTTISTKRYGYASLRCTDR